MKVAITYSGQPRDVEKTWNNHKKFLIDPLLESKANVDIFCHFWFDANKVGKEYVKGSYLIGRIKPNTDDFILKNLKPVKVKFEPERTFNGDLFKADLRFPHPVERTLSMFTSWIEVKEIMEEYEIKNNFNYDLVIRLRTDLVFYNKFPSLNTLKLNKVYVLDKFVHLDYGIVDTFAFSNSKNIKKYYSIKYELETLNNLGVAFNPETLLGYYLQNYLKLEIVKIKFRVKLFRVSHLKFHKFRTIGETIKFLNKIYIILKKYIKHLINNYK